MRKTSTCALLAVLVLAGLLSPASGVNSQVSDTLVAAKGDQELSNADIALQMSEITPFDNPDTVVISRDDEFADALASGVLQSNSPMLLVPPEGPVPAAVADRIADLGMQRAIVLGGEAAVSTQVSDDLGAMGLSVERRAGASRFETAIDIARSDAPDADTIILARAFPAEGAADPTQAYADSIAAGGLAAEAHYPILLTQTEQLTAPTAQYLQESGAQEVLVMGGTAAISEEVVDEVRAMGMSVERVAGASRFETAVAIADKRGEGADPARVTLVSGTPLATSFAQASMTFDPWAAGFAAAAHSAILDAPIVLAAGDELPEVTAGYITQTVQQFDGSTPVLTCAVSGSGCESSRRAAGLPPSATITFQPGSGSLAAGGTVSIGFGDHSGPATIAGSCLGGSQDVTVQPGEEALVNAADPLPAGACTVTVQVTLSNGAVQTDEATFNRPGATPVGGQPTAPPIVVEGEIATAGEMDDFTFEGFQGQRVFLDVRDDNTNPGVGHRLIDPSGGVEINGSTITSDRGAYTLEETGTYTLQIGSDNTSTGAYSLTMYFPGTSEGTTSYGATVSGTFDTPATRQNHSFSGVAGQRVFLDVRDDNTNVAVGHRLIDPAGGVELNGSTITSDRGTYTLEETGTYILQIGSDNDETGAYSLTFLLAPVQDFTTSLGSTVSGTISTPAELHNHSFTGTAGQRVFLDVRDDNTNAVVGHRLINPSGGVELNGSTITSDRGAYTLEETGTYILQIGSDNDETGAYSLMFLEAPVEQFSTAIGESISGTIGTPAELHDYTFSGTAGDTVGIDVADNNTNAVVGHRLINPSGGVELNGSTITSDRGPYTLEETGTYILQIGSDNDETGAYAFTFAPPG